MIVRSITMQNFMNHKDTTVRLPERGVVLVTGANGSGKSAVIEAVSYGLWGETLRGVSPWPDDVSSSTIGIGADDLMVTTLRGHSGRQSVAWTRDGEEPVEHDTKTKARSRLAKIIGSHEQWSSCAVFSSRDVGSFGNASDADRKRLLESILGLSRFDAAHHVCGGEYSEAVDQHKNASLRYETVKERIVNLTSQIGTLLGEEAALDARTPATPPSDGTVLGGMLDAATRDLRAVQDELRRSNRGDGAKGEQLRQVESQLAKFKTGRCGSCGQVLPLQDRDELQASASTLRESLVAESASRVDRTQVLVAQEYELQAELDQMRALRAASAAHAREAAAYADQRATLARMLSTAEAEHKKQQAIFVNVYTELRASTDSVNELEATRRVLGTRGVRAHVLGWALTGIETVANSWLAKLAGSGVRLKLEAQSVSKTGSISDTISMGISGVGGGRGYAATSGGERRRIDIALLLALSEVAAAANGQQAGTLFIDECFDALDTEGVRAVTEAIGDIAKHRNILLISHNPEVVAGVQATRRLRVDAGVIVEE